MRLPTVLVRTLFALLLLRMVAAPVALPSSSPRSHAPFHLVLRVCQWPAQRVQRSTPTPAARDSQPDLDAYRHRDWFTAPVHRIGVRVTESSLNRTRPALQVAQAAPLLGCLRC